MEVVNEVMPTSRERIEEDTRSQAATLSESRAENHTTEAGGSIRPLLRRLPVRAARARSEDNGGRARRAADCHDLPVRIVGRHASTMGTLHWLGPTRRGLAPAA